MKKTYPITKNPTVSIVVNAHDEGILLHRTLKSLNRNIVAAQKESVHVEVIVVADRVNEATLNYIKTRSKTALEAVEPRLELVTYGDLGLSRNHGIKLAKGEFIGNLDGDDLWSDNWIIEAVKVLREHERVVVHPAAVLNFGTKNGVWHIQNSTDPAFDPHSVIEDNWWPSCMMTQRETFDEVMYQRVAREHQFSFEDWLFNCETLYAGFEHLIVPETTLFYRRKPMSMLVAHSTGLPTPNSLFTPSGLDHYQKNHHTEVVQEKVAVRSKLQAASTPWNHSLRRKIVVKTVRASLGITMKVGRKFGMRFLNSHHRVKTFARSVYGATQALLAGPIEIDGQMIVRGSLLPSWLKEQWYRANEIDLQLFPTRHRVSTMYNRAMMTMGPEQQAYWSLAKEIGEKVEYLMLVPYVRRAGAYMVAMYYVKAFKELHPQADVVVFATERTYESITEMIPQGVRLVTIPDVFARLNQPLQEKVLAKLFTNLAPKRIHTLLSQEGFRALGRYGAQIAKESKIYLTVFNYDYTADGQRMNAFVAYGEPILPYVTKIFTDNEWVVDDSVDMYGLPRDVFAAHAMPVQLPDTEPEGMNLRPVDGKMRILWAARFAKQKRPDILYEIAKRALKEKLPYEFVIYGELYDKVITQKFMNDLCRLPNVQYRGPFSKGILGLPIVSFDVYLSTSEMEGTPNAILEAQAGGLLVVAPAVGGIPEVVEDKKTGMLIEDYENVEQYLAALKYVYEDEKRAQVIAQAGQKEVQTERSWQAFVKQVKKDLQ